MHAPLSPSLSLSSLPSSAPSSHHQPMPDGAALLRWMSQSLDHVGRGMVLLTHGARVLHANRLARDCLGRVHPLHIDAGRLRARHEPDGKALAEAVDAALQRGIRRMLTVGLAEQREAVAVLPFESAGGDAVLLSLSLPGRAQDLAVQCYAREHGFTGAETAVLEALLAGERPVDIARAKGVSLSTVRTQIGQLRSKSGAHGIPELLERVAAFAAHAVGGAIAPRSPNGRSRFDPSIAPQLSGDTS